MVSTVAEPAEVGVMTFLSSPNVPYSYVVVPFGVVFSKGNDSLSLISFLNNLKNIQLQLEKIKNKKYT